MKKEIQNLGELESFLKQHNLTYPKHWKSLFKKKKRKPKDATEWKHVRIYSYATARLRHCLDPAIEVIRETVDKMSTEQAISNFEKLNVLEMQSLREKIKNMPRPEIHRIMKSLAEGVTKKGGKIFFQLPLKNSETEFFHLFTGKHINKIKFVDKIETIRRIVKDVYYWKGRKLFLNKPIEDMENQSLVRKTHCFNCKENINSQQWIVCDDCIRKEEKEYYKSVCDYVEDPPYNNKNFFIKLDPETKETWNKYWNFYLKIR